MCGLPAGGQISDIRDGEVVGRWRTSGKVMGADQISIVDRCIVKARMIVLDSDRLVEFPDGVHTALAAVDRLHNRERPKAENTPVNHRAFSTIRVKNIFATMSQETGWYCCAIRSDQVLSSPGERM